MGEGEGGRLKSGAGVVRAQESGVALRLPPQSKFAWHPAKPVHGSATF